MTISRARARIALGVLSLTYLVSYMDRTVLAVLQEPIKAEFNLSDWQLGLLGGPAFAILYSLTGVPIARLAERFNRARLIAACVSIWSLMTAACGMVHNYWQMLVARAGVAVGEAGGNPASHSLIADLFAPHSRARAVAIYTLGVPVGAFLGAVLGGLLAQHYGWRGTFIILGLAGALLSIIVLALIPNVTRGRFDEDTPDDSKGGADHGATPPSTMAVLRALGANRAFIQLAIASSIVVLVGYSLPAFLVSFMMRSHDLSVAQGGLVAGIVSGAGGIIGTVAAGQLADWLGPKDRRWYGWLSALAMLVACPVLIAGLLIGNVVLVTAFLTLGMALMFVYIPPTFAQIHAMVNARMRATATSIFYLIINLAGLGLGPPAVGWLSDRLAAKRMQGPVDHCFALMQQDGALADTCTDALGYGLRLALLAICVLLLWSAVHYWRAGIIFGQQEGREKYGQA